MKFCAYLATNVLFIFTKYCNSPLFLPQCIHKIWIWTWKRVNLNLQSIFKRGTLLGNEEPPNELNWIWTWKKVKTTYEFLKCATLIHNFKIKFMALELPQKSKGLDHLAMTKRNNSKSLNFMWLCRLCRFRSKKAYPQKSNFNYKEGSTWKMVNLNL